MADKEKTTAQEKAEEEEIEVRKERQRTTFDDLDLCSEGVQTILGIVKLALKIIQLVVPIGLIMMTTIDVFKHVINPDSKEGMKKIGTRVISAIVVFLVPILLDLVITLINVGDASVDVKGSSIWSCWESANEATLNNN